MKQTTLRVIEFSGSEEIQVSTLSGLIELRLTEPDDCESGLVLFIPPEMADKIVAEIEKQRRPVAKAWDANTGEPISIKKTDIPNPHL